MSISATTGDHVNNIEQVVIVTPAGLMLSVTELRFFGGQHEYDPIPVSNYPSPVKACEIEIQFISWESYGNPTNDFTRSIY
jgi:hypothetical protein